MDGVVSLLDGPHYQKVEALWAELAERFDARGVYITPYPHFSYHIARRYNRAQLDPLLAEIAATSRPFTVRTGGIGVFTGLAPVLYISVVRNAALSDYHARLWTAVNAASADAGPYYNPDDWMPHITIGFGDIYPTRLSSMIGTLSSRAFLWEIPIDNLALIYETAAGQEMVRFPFG